MGTLKKLMVTMISIIIIIIFIIVIILFKINKDTTNTITTTNSILVNQIANINNENISNDFNTNTSQEEEKEVLEYIKSEKEYNTVNALYQGYINKVMYGNFEIIKSIMPEEFIEKNNINEENIYQYTGINKAENEDSLYNIIINYIYEKKINNTKKIYLVDGYLRKNDEKKEIKILMMLDSKSKKYIVYPEKYLKDNNYYNLNIGDDIEIEIKEIKANEYNSFIYISKTDAEIAQNFYSELKEKLQYYPELVYKNLEENYSKEKFKNYDDFIETIKNNKKIISLMNINKYKIEKKNDYTDYVCSDKYDNIVIFRKNNANMYFSIILDNYTIRQEYDEEYYESLNDKGKGEYCITCFRNMLNTKDYNAMYEKLNTNFKQNYFTNIDDFKKYVNENFYEINGITVSSYNEENKEYTIYECKLENKLNSSETKNMTFVIKLNSNNSTYEMLFSFN